MPVFKYRSIEDMPGELWRPPGDPELYRAIERLWAAGRRLRRHRFPPGVTKHRSIEAMNLQQEQWARLDRA